MEKQAISLEDWNLQQYKHGLRIENLPGSAIFKEFVSRTPVSDKDHTNGATGGKKRFNLFLSLITGTPIWPDGYACASFSALLSNSNSSSTRGRGDLPSTHYAHAYYRRIIPLAADGTPLYEYTTYETEPEYICVAPTFDSKDGEYRSRFIPYSAFLKAYDTMTEEFQLYEETVMDMVTTMGLVLNTVVYPEYEPIIDAIADCRIIISAFVVALYLDLEEVKKDMIMDHTTAPYKDLMMETANKYPQLTEISSQSYKLSQATSEKYRKSLNVFRSGSERGMAVICGQKLIPTYVEETLTEFNVNFPGWRELFATMQVGDLVLNQISPSFSLFNSWTYVLGTNETLYENTALRARWRRSEEVSRAAAAVQEARSALLAEGVPNSAVYELREVMYESLALAQRALIMSPVCLMVTMEDTGRTLANFGGPTRGGTTPVPDRIRVLTDSEVTARFLFEWVYAAHCLHSKLGIVHTDLHSNNITVYEWGLTQRKVVDKAKRAAMEKEKGAKLHPNDVPVNTENLYNDPVVVYVTGPRGDADTFVFRSTASSGCIIDYSRAIYGTAMRPRLERHHTKQFVDNFYTDQRRRVLQTMHRYAPQFVEKHEADLRDFIEHDFDSAFLCLCYVDFIGIGRNVAAALALENKKLEIATKGAKHRVDPKGIALAKQIESLALDRFVLSLNGRLKAWKAKRAGAAPDSAAPGSAAPDSAAPDSEAVRGGTVRGDGPRVARDYATETVPPLPELSPDARNPFPGHSFLASAFTPWNFAKLTLKDPARMRTIEPVDLYNYNNELTYNVREYNKFPPWARFDLIERHLNQYKLSEIFREEGRAFLRSLEPGSVSALVAEQARREVDRFSDGADVQATSSTSSWHE